MNQLPDITIQLFKEKYFAAGPGIFSDLYIDKANQENTYIFCDILEGKKINVDNLISNNSYELLFNSEKDYPYHLCNFFEGIDGKDMLKNNQLRIKYAFDIIVGESGPQTRTVHFSSTNSKFFKNLNWPTTKYEVPVDNIILLVPISVINKTAQFRQIPLKIIRDSYFQNLCGYKYSSILQDCIVNNREDYLLNIKRLFDSHQNKLENFESISLPISIINLKIGNNILKVYPIYFQYIIDEIGMLYDETIIEQLSIKLSDNVISHESFKDLSLESIKLFFKHVYKATLPNLTELCKLESLKSQLKYLEILANYFGIKYYNSFYLELYNSIKLE